MNRGKPSSARWAVTVILLSGLLGAAILLLHRHAAAQGPPAPDRGAIKSRMGRHGASLTGLGRAVVMLDLTTAARQARQIADEELVARSLDTDRKNERAGESFGALQEELRARAARLAAEAGARNDLGVADAFGELAKTCVRCHRLYLPREGRPGP
jgi:hypothetical protein